MYIHLDIIASKNCDDKLGKNVSPDCFRAMPNLL